MRSNKYIFLLFCTLFLSSAVAQNKEITLRIFNEKGTPLENVVVEMKRSTDSVLVRTAVSGKDGVAKFMQTPEGFHYFTGKLVGYPPTTTASADLSKTNSPITLRMVPASNTIEAVAVTAKKQFIQRTQGKTIVNVDASVTNAGTSVLEVLEKSPGVMVDRNGGISLQGKPSVLIMIDDKPTYLSGAELNNLLSTMNSSQVNQIELITNPSAKYDASGNAGIINIKTKKNIQEGFNGNLSTAFGYGRYHKNNNALTLNYRKGKFNSFLNYSLSLNKGFTDIYALREYYGPGNSLEAILDQPTYLTSAANNNTLKIGTDFYASANTTIGIALSGSLIGRDGAGNAQATWLNPQRSVDSAIVTTSTSDFAMKNGAVNLSLRHKLNTKSDLAFDIDALRYQITNDQEFVNTRNGVGGYVTGSLGDIPSALSIFSAKGDYTLQIGKAARLESGLKTSAISTDNIADYQIFDGTQWQIDLNKSNHFLYKEYINSAYTSFDMKHKALSAQFGLRYENTHYNAHQLGNSIKPDSAFSKNYSSLFPSGYISLQADSLNNFTLTAGRRIDRPAYQKLNPFVFIINKYTHQQGNPYFLPQYSWNLELSHSWKNALITTLSFATIKNYFSQLFLSKGNDILVYTDGNVGSAHTVGLSLAARFSFAKWWSFNGQSTFNYKKLNGYQNVNYSSSIAQLHTNINNQFRINKTLNAELSGFYTTRARNDLQEVLTPTGQVSIGFGQTVFKGAGTLRLTARDLFYTQAMEGYTDFPNAYEYFILWRDTRVVNLGFSYRFGKPLKPTKRSLGGATDEINRVG